MIDGSPFGLMMYMMIKFDKLRKRGINFMKRTVSNAFRVSDEEKFMDIIRNCKTCDDEPIVVSHLQSGTHQAKELLFACNGIIGLPITESLGTKNEDDDINSEYDEFLTALRTVVAPSDVIVISTLFDEAEDTRCRTDVVTSECLQVLINAPYDEDEED